MRLAFFFSDDKRVAITDQKRLHTHYDVDDYNLYLWAVSHWYTQLYKSSRLIWYTATQIVKKGISHLNRLAIYNTN